MVRSGIVRTNGGVYKRPVVNLTPELPRRDVFAMVNRPGDVVVELTNSRTKLNSASRPFQVVKLEWHDGRILMLHSITATSSCSLCQLLFLIIIITT